jgi:hypothetical protein
LPCLSILAVGTTKEGADIKSREIVEIVEEENTHLDSGTERAVIRTCSGKSWRAVRVYPVTGGPKKTSELQEK